VAEFGCVWQYYHDRYAEHYKEVADDLPQYGREPISSIPFQLPVGCLQLDTDDLSLHASDNVRALVVMDPTFFFKFHS
jgi:hypothetical protein